MIAYFADEFYCVTLRQRREHIKSLCSRWSNPLVSLHRFDTQTKEATALSLRLTGHSPERSLFWVSATTVEAPEATAEEADPAFVAQEPACEPEHAVLLDYLADAPLGPADEDDASEPPIISAKIVWIGTKVYLTSHMSRMCNRFHHFIGHNI